MVRNKLCWDASYTVRLPKQRNSYQSSPTFLCFGSSTASFASQHNLFRTMWPDPAKGPFLWRSVTLHHPSEQEQRIKLTLCSSKTFLLLFFLDVEQEKGKSSKALLPASVPECKDLEKQALEIELQRQENQEQQDDSKMTWKQWFKNPDFYKVKYDSCTFVLLYNYPFQSVSQSVSQSINRSVSQSVSQSINQSITQSVNQSVSQSVNQSINRSVSQSTNQSINQSINQSVSQSVSQSIFIYGE